MKNRRESPRIPKRRTPRVKRQRSCKRRSKRPLSSINYFCEIALNLKPSESEIANLDHLDLPRLRDKSSKAREVAMELGNLRIPHQDVRAL